MKYVNPFSRVRVLSVLTGFLVGLPLAHATDGTTLVPIDSTEAPASDLVYQGQPIDQDSAVSLKNKGVDLSTLDPVPNDMYGSPYTPPTTQMPEDGGTVNYDSALQGYGQEISVHRVTIGSNAYHLDVSLVPERALMTRALLVKLGYNQLAPRHYKKLTLQFKSAMDVQSFEAQINLDTVKDPSTWVIASPSSTELTLQDVVLEPPSSLSDPTSFFFNEVQDGFDENRRALRALLVPISLCDVPENVDSYTWDLDRILSNSLLIPYPNEVFDAHPYDDSTIDDVRWMARKVATLTVADWTDIVNQGGYPSDIAAVVLQKIIARRNQMLSTMNLPYTALPYNVHITNASVQDGQVVVANFPGYASRFTYGDAVDPLGPKQLVDLGIMQGLSSGMEALAGEINTKLVVASTANALAQHEEQVIGQFIQHMVQNPNAPYTQPISTWGGPVANFQVTANRSITTGTFYGSSAAIQLVDTVGVTGNAGYFRGIDGIKNLVPSLQANVTVGRNYTHVRSVPTIAAALKTSPVQFLVPKMLVDLSKILANPPAVKSGQTAPTGTATQQVADYTTAVEDLLSQLNDGDIFTITDTLAGGANASATVPITALFPGAPVGYNQGISFGAGVQGVITRRITLNRVNNVTTGDNYLQIYSETIDSLTGSATLDFNYWINVVNFGVNKQKGFAHARVYTVQHDTSRDQTTSKALALALRSTLTWNTDTALQKNFPYYELYHDIDESDWEAGFIFFQAKNLAEKHLLRIDPPADPTHTFNPKDYERTLFSYRVLDRTGFNFMNTITDAISAWSQGTVTLNLTAGSNPAYSLFGNAHWTQMYTDAELTQGKDYSFNPVTISTETWAGWSISQKSLFKIFDTIDAEIGILKNFGVELSPIHRDIFAATQTLEFYNITANTIFYPAGLTRIFTVLEPTPIAGQYKPNFIDKISEDGYSATDQQVVKNITDWIGAIPYQQMCVASYPQLNNKNTNPPAHPGMIFKGNTYPCIDSWTESVLDLRRQKPADTDKQDLIVWETKMMKLLEEKIPLPKLMQVAQKDGFFFQISVNGFRKGDHEATDSEAEEVIANYVSDSVGTADQNLGSGAFNALATQTKIMGYEVNGVFFTGGD